MHSAIASRSAVRATPRRLWALAGAAFCLLTLGAFLVSVHWGLFGYNESLGGPWQERAGAVEAAGVIACALAAKR